MLHRQHGQFQPDHPPDLARPEPAAVDDVLGVDRVVAVGDHVPRTVGALRQPGDPCVGVDLGAAVAGADRVGVGDAVRVDRPLVRVVQGADEEALLEQGVELLGLGDRDQVHVHPEVATAGASHAQPVEPFRGVGQHQPAREVDAAVLP